MDSALQELSDLREQVLERAGWVESLDVSCRDVAAVDVLDELESLKNTIAAVQARLAVSLKQARVAQRAHQPAPLRERGIGAEVGLARRESPHRGGIHLGLAVVLVGELPHTLVAMEAGWCSEWRAIQIAQGTACLSRADRERIDEQLMADPATTDGWGDRRFRAEVDKLAYAADPAAAVARHAQAVADRHTSLRPAPDGMVRFSALVPLAQEWLCTPCCPALRTQPGQPVTSGPAGRSWPTASSAPSSALPWRPPGRGRWCRSRSR